MFADLSDPGGAATALPPGLSCLGTWCSLPGLRMQQGPLSCLIPWPGAKVPLHFSFKFAGECGCAPSFYQNGWRYRHHSSPAPGTQAVTHGPAPPADMEPLTHDSPPPVDNFSGCILFLLQWLEVKYPHLLQQLIPQARGVPSPGLTPGAGTSVHSHTALTTSWHFVLAAHTHEIQSLYRETVKI